MSAGRPQRPTWLPTRHRPLTLALTACLVTLPTRPASAQFSEPCGLACAGVLGTTAFVTATGVSVGFGRATGGLNRVNQALLVWGSTFAAVAGGGIALAGDGARQERAVYAAGLGLLAGAVTGLAAEAIRTGGDGPRVVAGTLIAAAAGAIVGGVYGAVSHDPADPSEPVPLLTLSVPF